MVLDTKGRPVNIRRFSTALTNWENYGFTYNGDELATYTKSSNSNPNIEPRIATYANGDLVKLESSTISTSYEYYPDKVQVGDFLNVLAIIDYGFILYPQQHLLKSSSNGVNTVYQMNSDGLIVKANVTTGGNDLVWAYQYECN